jgi:hypothetical protein
MKPFRPSRARPAPKPCRLSNSPCVIKITKPSQRGRDELQEIGQPALEDILKAKFGPKNWSFGK